MIQNKLSDKGFRGLSSFELKCIAMLSMVIDHMGAICFTDAIWMRCIGRLAMPIYCFLLVEGYIHTSSFKKYFGRMLIFALISEVPYDYVFFGSFAYIRHQNMFFTLAVGLLCMYLLDQSMQKLWYLTALAAVCGLMHHFIRSDYGLMGIGMIMVYYILHRYKVAKHIAAGAMNLCAESKLQCFGAAAALPLLLYNGKKGSSVKYFFYWFYPVHLLLIYFIWRFVLYVG